VQRELHTFNTRAVSLPHETGSWWLTAPGLPDPTAVYNDQSPHICNSSSVSTAAAEARGNLSASGVRMPVLTRRLPIPLPESTREMARLRKAAASGRFRYGQKDELGIAQNLACIFQAKLQQLFSESSASTCECIVQSPYRHMMLACQVSRAEVRFVKAITQCAH